MFWTILTTVLITALIMILLFALIMCYDSFDRTNAECKRLRKDNDRMADELQAISDREINRRMKAKYDQGLYDGRATDTLYRNILKNYQTKDQVRVMMDGEDCERSSR